MVRGDGHHQPGEMTCLDGPYFSSGFSGKFFIALLSPSGAGEVGDGANRDDPAAPLSVHNSSTRDGHVQPKREYNAKSAVSRRDKEKQRWPFQHPPCA